MNFGWIGSGAVRFLKGRSRAKCLAYRGSCAAKNRRSLWKRKVVVTCVETMKFSDVADRMGKAKEWPDDVLLQGMREHYPAIELESEVVVIHHLPPDV